MTDRIFRDGHPFIPWVPEHPSHDEALARGEELLSELEQRRSIRFFSDAPVDRSLIELAIRAAGTAPSGAHMQPWTFVAVSDPELKRRIRLAAEQEERRSYAGRMSDEWRRALAPLGTDADKSYLETVPWLVVVFAQLYGLDQDGNKRKHYYVKESVGIACGLFIGALHRMGLCTLTHTPSPMKFLSEILGRPANEQAYILFPVGYASSDCVVPDITRKTLRDISVWNPGLDD